MSNELISIIIRTNNEERWISACLSGISKQTHKNFEIILVDNNSTDKTLEKARKFAVKIVNINEYRPGKALNAGIKASRGRFIANLSAHCIPVNEKWLENLIKNFDGQKIAGVYGRQEPLSHTPDFDKRDLLNIFGLDRRVQVKDSFFHNANSMILKSVWEKIPFDERVTNIEDRVWAKRVLDKGYRIIYEPQASVYHYHGIHQNNDAQRCYNVVRILESLEGTGSARKKSLNINDLNITAIIPVKGGLQYLNKIPLIDYTIAHCRQSSYIKDIIVSTDNQDVARVSRKLGARVPFVRDANFSSEYIPLDKVLQYSLEQIEKSGIFPDILAILEVTFPFRPYGLLDKMIKELITKGLDSVLAVRPEYKSCWVSEENKNSLKRIDEGFLPRSMKRPIYIGLMGLGCVTYPVFVRDGRRLGDKVGVFEVSEPFASIEVRDEADFKLSNLIVKDWSKNNLPGNRK